MACACKKKKLANTVSQPKKTAVSTPVTQQNKVVKRIIRRINRH